MTQTNIKIAYIIQCHKNFEQVVRLIKSLSIAEFDNVVVHIDKKNKDLNGALLAEFKNTKNINIIQNPILVNWSGLSQVKATLSMLYFLKYNNISYDYCVFLSGECMPIKSSQQLRCFLLKENKSHIEVYNKNIQSYRVNRFHFFREQKYNRTYVFRFINKIFLYLQKLIPRRNNFAESDIHKGSCWFVLKSKHCSFILSLVSNGYLDKFKYTTCADEHFFQMALVNSPYKSELSFKNLHYLNFIAGSSSPEYVNFEDVNKASAKEDVFFIRKVSKDFQLFMLNKLTQI